MKIFLDTYTIQICVKRARRLVLWHGRNKRHETRNREPLCFGIFFTIGMMMNRG